jgi:hypothetical protein
MAGAPQMNALPGIAAFCLAAIAFTGCDNGSRPSASARPERPLEILGYQLGMSESAVVERGATACRDHPEAPDADRICHASASVAGQPALLFFYFYDGTLEKVALTILPKHGQLAEVNRAFSEEMETKYGKPSTGNSFATTWSRKDGAIAVSHEDERTLTIHLTSGKYDEEKLRRTTRAGRGTEV